LRINYTQLMAFYMKKESIPNAFTMFIVKSIISDDTSFRRSRAGTVGGKARSKNLNGDGIQNVHQLKVNSKLTESKSVVFNTLGHKERASRASSATKHRV